LISSDFIASDFIWETELPLLLAAAGDGLAIFPVILRPCNLGRMSNLSQFQAVNQQSNALNGISEHAQDCVWVKLVTDIEAIFNSEAPTGAPGHLAANPRAKERSDKPERRPIRRVPPRAGLAEPDASMSGDPSRKDEPPDDQDENRWREHRLTIRKRLEESFGRLSGTEGRDLLRRMAKELTLAEGPDDLESLRKQIIDHLVDAQDEKAIGKVIGFLRELYGEGLDRVAKQFKDCVLQILHLYFPREPFSRVRHQHEVQKAALIEGAVATVMAVELVMSRLDGELPSYMLNQDKRPIPRGEHYIPLEAPAIGDPSSEDEVLEMLEDLAKGAGVGIGKRGPSSQRKDVAARTEQLRRVLRGRLSAIDSVQHRTPYVPLTMPEVAADRDHLKTVLNQVRDLVPLLVFWELSQESPTIEQEEFLNTCLGMWPELERK
jgi:hypothetical protein